MGEAVAGDAEKDPNFQTCSKDQVYCCSLYDRKVSDFFGLSRRLV